MNEYTIKLSCKHRNGVYSLLDKYIFIHQVHSCLWCASASHISDTPWHTINRKHRQKRNCQKQVPMLFLLGSKERAILAVKIGLFPIRRWKQQGQWYFCSATAHVTEDHAMGAARWEPRGGWTPMELVTNSRLMISRKGTMPFSWGVKNKFGKHIL